MTIALFIQTGRPSNSNKLEGISVGRLILTGGPGPKGDTGVQGDPGEQGPPGSADVTEAAVLAALGFTPEEEGVAASALNDHLAAADPHPGYVLETTVGVSVASLVDGKVPSAQLPSYVDDVLEYADLASLPVTGETGKIYVTLDSNNQYRWSGSAYVELVASPGSTDAVPEGSSNLYFTVARVRAAILTGLDVALTGAVSATDTVLQAFGRLQNSITAHFGAGGSAHADVVSAGASGFMTGTQATKLAGIATAATANDTDANLKDRANHTGTQATSTLSQSGATTSQVIQWNGSAWVPATVAASPGGSTTQLQYNNAGAFGGIPGTTFASNTLAIVSQAAAAVPFAVQAATSQTGNLTEWRNSVGTVLSRISSGGLVRAHTGAKATPTYSFDAEPGLGFYRRTGGEMTLAFADINVISIANGFAGMRFYDTWGLSFVGSSAESNASAVAGMHKKVNGVIEFNNGTRNSYAGSAFGAGSQTVAQLPTASTSEGARTMVTDSNATLAAGLGNTVAGGGSNKVPVHSNGANWIIG